MLDINLLEKRWLRYKMKRLLPVISIIIILLSVLVSTLILLPESNVHKPITANKPASVQQSVAKNAAQISNDVNNTLLLEPSMEFMQNLSSQDPIPEASASKPVIHQKIPPIIQVTSIPKETVISLETPKESQIKTSSTKQTASLISKTENKIDIANLESRFKENPNASLGLFISRYYYDKSDYAQSYNYALKTNSMNGNLEESWIIFTKSLVKLGKTEQAKKTLNIYIEQSNSDSAKALLYSIEKGTFK